MKVRCGGVPIERFSHPVLKLWRAYFGFSFKLDGSNSSDKRLRKNGKMSGNGGGGGGSRGLRKRRALGKGQRKRRRQKAAGQTYMIAQIPHAIVVSEGDYCPPTSTLARAFVLVLNK